MATSTSTLGVEAQALTRWRPAIHMPRWASRITLEVDGVGIQRLQEITDWQCLAEGMPAISLPAGSPLARAWFKEAWDDIRVDMGEAGGRPDDE